jgi:DNA-binding transcriptional MerR regulator
MAKVEFELKLKQASVVLGVPPKDLQNFVQAGVLKPRRRGSVYYFDRDTLLQAKVALYLKASLGASTRYLSRFADAVSAVPGFTSTVPDVVCLTSGIQTNESPVRILIPLGDLAKELNQRLPLAEAAKDLPRGRKRSGWKREFLAAMREAANDLQGVSEKEILDAVRGYRKGRSKPELTVVAEAAEATT